MTPRSLAPVVALAALFFVAAGCGDDGTDLPDDAAHACRLVNSLPDDLGDDDREGPLGRAFLFELSATATLLQGSGASTGDAELVDPGERLLAAIQRVDHDLYQESRTDAQDACDEAGVSDALPDDPGDRADAHVATACALTLELAETHPSVDDYTVDDPAFFDVASSGRLFRSASELHDDHADLGEPTFAINEALQRRDAARYLRALDAIGDHCED